MCRCHNHYFIIGICSCSVSSTANKIETKKQTNLTMSDRCLLNHCLLYLHQIYTAGVMSLNTFNTLFYSAVSILRAASSRGSVYRGWLDRRPVLFSTRIYLLHNAAATVELLVLGSAITQFSSQICSIPGGHDLSTIT